MRRKEKKNSAYIYIRLYHTYQSYPLSSSKFLVFKFFLKIIYFFFDRAGSVAQLGKNLPAMREIWVQSLGWEDRLEKGKATHSSILAWRIPWTVKSMGLQRVGHS